MTQQPKELIKSRQFAESLSMAVFLVDPLGNLFYYNEAAEEILGVRFAEAGPMPVDVWSTIFVPTNYIGKPLKPDALPLVQTLTFHRPAHGSFYIESKQGLKYLITVTSFPIIGKPDKMLGAMAMFWKSKAE